MTRAVPALYLAILAIFVAAGSLLTARSDPATTTASLPEECADIPPALVAELVPAGAAPVARTTLEEDARYGRWTADDGTLLLELRCARFRFADLGDFRSAMAAAEAGRGTVLDTDPPAILTEVPDGTIIRQLDEPSGVLRSWFVRDDLTDAEAADVVQRTRAGQDEAGAEADAGATS